jgi:phage baseplate assembly protein V
MNLNELFRLLLNLARKGTIVQVDHAAGLCRVATGELRTNWIPWLAVAAGTTRDWRPPAPDEQVLLICPGGDPADAVALCGIYSDKAPAPGDSPDTHTRIYPDGALVEYDHVAHRLTATLPAGGEILVAAPAAVTVRTQTARLEADLVEIVAPTTRMSGDLEVAGKVSAGQNITTPADVKAGSVSLSGHTHLEQGDGKPVGKPQ